MNIVSLEAENIKALKAVSITPDGSMVQITGRNGQGKSSILDAIFWSIAGTKHIQAEPIRTGENKARIKLDMGELIVERKFTATGSTLTVQNADGAKYSSPQSMLTDLLGALTFDPLAFVSQKPKDQFETLRQTLGLDFSAIDYDIDTTFEERADINRDAKKTRAAGDAIKIEGTVVKERVDVGEVADAIGKAADHNADIARRKANREGALDTIRKNREEADQLRAKAKLLVDEAESLAEQLDDAPALPDAIDTDELRAKLESATELNKAFDQWERKEAFRIEADDLETRSKALTDQLTALKSDKATMIAMADMPVPGLGFGDDVVTLDGVPFDQASTAQQIRTSVALAMAANPKLKVIMIREGSFLDDTNLALIAGMAEEHGYQIWVERVDSTGKVGIVIEDGEVAAVNERAA